MWCKAYVWCLLTLTSNRVGYSKWTFLKLKLPFISSGYSPSVDQLLIGETRSITENTFAPAPFAMENASINGDVIPKFIEAIMTPKNTCYKIIHVHISLQSDVCIKNAKTRQGPHSGI